MRYEICKKYQVEGSLALKPEFGPGGKPSAVSTPIFVRKSLSSCFALIEVFIFSSDSGRGSITLFARYIVKCVMLLFIAFSHKARR